MDLKIEGDMSIVSNCPICEERGLHIIGEENFQTQQCINCGYATAFKFKLNDSDKEDNESYKTLSDQMKDWSKVANDHIWIPSFITLPVGMLFPTNIDNMVNHQVEMKWAYAPMVDIPEDERENFPVEGQKDKFYERKYDTDNAEIYDEFVVAMSKLNEMIKAHKDNA